MFGLDVKDDRVPGVVEGEGAIGFIALGDHEGAIGIPLGVGTEDGNFRAHVV